MQLAPIQWQKKLERGRITHASLAMGSKLIYH